MRLIWVFILALVAGSANAERISVYGAASSAPPSSCAGTINLSTGCVQPMFGGL